jgi:hypothetical protein
MQTTSIYRGLKDRLNNIAPVSRYINQYDKGNGNTTYTVPALYIEMPRNFNIDFLPGKLQVAKGCVINIHLITNAPYKAQDNTVQDAAIDDHDAKLKAIDALLTGYALRDNNNRLLTEQFIPTNQKEKMFDGVHCISVLTYTTSIYSRHLQ